MREKINANDSFFELVTKLGEGNPGAMNVIMSMINKNPAAFLQLLSLDDMNIRGSQIWVAYKDYCGESIDLFLDAVKKRDETMIEAVNIVSAKSGLKDKAIRSGASYMEQYPLMTDEEIKSLAKKDVPVNANISQME